MPSMPRDWTYQTFAGMVSTPMHVGTVALSAPVLRLYGVGTNVPARFCPSASSFLQAPVMNAPAGC